MNKAKQVQQLYLVRVGTVLIGPLRAGCGKLAVEIIKVPLVAETLFVQRVDIAAEQMRWRLMLVGAKRCREVADCIRLITADINAAVIGKGNNLSECRVRGLTENADCQAALAQGFQSQG